MILTNMNIDRSSFIRSLFNYLENKNYIWLKATSETPESVPVNSDIDLLIRSNDLDEVLYFITSHLLVDKCQSRSENGVLFLLLLFTDGSSLKLDLLTKLIRKQWTYLEEEYVFKNRIRQNGTFTYTHELLLEHTLIFNALNHSGLPQKYVDFFHKIPEAGQRQLLDFINEKYDLAFPSIAAMAEFDRSVRKQLVSYLKRKPENSPLRRLKSGFEYFSKNLVGRNHFSNEVITFSGVDGAGKTTLLNDLKTVLAEQHSKKVVVLRHRPSLFPILSAWQNGKAAAEAKAATTLPRQGRNNSRISSLLRFAYYYADYLIGQVYVWFRYILPGYTVIYDRYYFDFIVDGKRSNIALGERLPRWLYRFVAKPALNIFLYADPAVIRQRKQELPAADIEQMTGRYRALFNDFAGHYSGQYLCIENNDRTQSLHTILKHYARIF